MTASPPDDWAERLPEPSGRSRETGEPDERARFGEPSDLTWLVIQKMRYLRMARGMSAQELERQMAEKAGVVMSRAVIANLENQRRRDLSVDQLVGLSKVFDAPLDFLLGFTNVECNRCKGEPPEGFGCLTCGAQG